MKKHVGTIEIVLHKKVNVYEETEEDARKELERIISSTQWNNFFGTIADVKSVSLKDVFTSRYNDELRTK